MKILLTAPPGIGKSTVIARVAEQFAGAKCGIVAREILNDSGVRTGFTAVNQTGLSRQFMFATETPGPHSIANFDVDVAAIDEFVVAELREGSSQEANERLMYIDEIGRAQAKSSSFLAVLRDIMSLRCNVLASIVFDDEPWSLEFKRDKRVCLIEVTPQNRNFLADIFLSAYNSSAQFHSLNQAQQELVYHLLHKLVECGHFISARKLFDNALGYVTGRKISQPSANSFSVEGLTDSHKITRSGAVFHCDCHLANGTGPFLNAAAICSHEMSIRILDLA